MKFVNLLMDEGKTADDVARQRRNRRKFNAETQRRRRRRENFVRVRVGESTLNVMTFMTYASGGRGCWWPDVLVPQGGPPSPLSESGGGPPHYKTQARFGAPLIFRV
jgi:hypothetical protein